MARTRWEAPPCAWEVDAWSDLPTVLLPSVQRFLTLSAPGCPSLKDGQALRSVERPGLDPVQNIGLIIQFRHRTGQADPIQYFLLPGCFHLSQGRIAPLSVVPGTEVFKECSICLQVRIDPVVLLGEEGVGPA